MEGNLAIFVVPENYDYDRMTYEQRLFATELKTISLIEQKLNELKPIYTSELKKLKESTPDFSDWSKTMVNHHLLKEADQSKEISKYFTLLEKKDFCIEKLWLAIEKFAYSEINRYSKKYKRSSDYWDDLKQVCALNFISALANYNPFRHTPSTYFKYYFLEGISKYLRDESQHLTQNDANNFGRLNAAKKEFLARGIEHPDMEMLSEASGLSLKVTKNTLLLANNSQYADIDEQYDLADKRLNPEQEFFKNQKISDVRSAITDLTPDEQEFLLYYWNPEEDKERNYKSVGEHFGYTPSETKAILNDIIKKLADNKSLQAYNSNKHEEIPRVSLLENTSNEVADAIFNELIKKKKRKKRK